MALQKPETQQAVKQVEVDAESAQLQKPETHQVTHLGILATFSVQPPMHACLCWLKKAYSDAYVRVLSPCEMSI